jgi:hypothetical protein
VVADIDNDGWADLWVTNLYQSGPKQPQALSEYWIGIDGTPPDEALRAQLEIPPGRGLLVNQVVEESPAAKAGLKQYDVLLACQDKPLAEIAELAKIIEEKKESLLSLRLIRGGKRIIVEITPQKRPASQTGDTCPAVSKVDDATFLRRVWLDLLGSLPEADEIQKFSVEKQEKKREVLVNRLLRKSTVASRSCTACHADDGHGWQSSVNSPLVRWETEVFKFPHGGNNYVKRLIGLPGAVVNEIDGALVEKLPDDVSVSVTLKGSEVAKITVKKGDRTWDLTNANDQKELPDESRGYVAALLAAIRSNAGTTLGGAQHLTQELSTPWRPLRFKLDLVTDRADLRELFATGGTPGVDRDTRPSAPEAAFDKLDKQLESLGSQLGELRKAMHDLQQTLKSEKGKSTGEEKK